MNKTITLLTLAASMLIATTAAAQDPDCTAYVDVPYSTGFEGLATGQLPDCWTQFATSSGFESTQFPCAYAYGPNARNSNVYFEFESHSPNGMLPQVVALPPMQNLPTLKFSFWASASSSYLPVFEVGVMEDTVFVPVDTIEFTTFSGANGWASNYHKYTVFFSDYAGSGDRIAMRAKGQTTAQYTLFLDDISVEVADAPEVSMQASAFTNINTDLVLTATCHGLDPLTYTWSSTMANAGNATMVAADNVLTINYSAAGIDTVMLVVSNAAGADTARTVVRAVDLNPVTTFPYSTGFEEGDDISWITNNNGNNGWYIGSAAANGGSNGLYISNDNGASNAYSINGTATSYAFRYLQLDAGEYAYSFDWRSVGENNWDYLTVHLAPAGSDLMADNVSTSNWEDLCGRLQNQNSWQNITGTFTVAEEGSYPFVFRWYNDGSAGSQPPAAVDNIAITALSCPTVGEIVLDSASSEMLAFHWTPNGSETEWELTIGDADPISVNDTSYEALSLSANTEYTITVRAICGSDDTSFATTATFRTECGSNAIPFTEDFESLPSGAPLCWNVLSGGVEVTNNSYYAHQSSKCLRFNNGTTNLAVLPAMEQEINTLQISLWTRPEDHTNSSCGSLSVGYLPTATSDASAFVELANFAFNEFSSGGHEERIVTLQAAPDGARIALRHNAVNAWWYWFVDDITVEPIATCLPVEQLHTEQLTSTTATIAWIDTLNQGTWLVKLGDGEWESAFDTTFTFTDLTPSTSYTAHVAADCGGGDTSHVYAITFRTECGNIADTSYPWTEDFSDATNLLCWTLLDNDGNNVTWNHNPYLGRLQAPYNSAGPDDWAISPIFDIPADADGLSLTWDVYGNSYEGLVAHYQVLISPTAGSTPASFTDTIFDESYATPHPLQRSTSLSDYAGMTIRFAFRHINTGDDDGMYIDNLAIRMTNEPVAHIDGPGSTDINVQVGYAASLLEGSQNGLSYTWSSTMATAGHATMTTANDSLHITYTSTGTDTISVVATNNFGADTATITVMVYDLSPATLPFTTDFETADGGWIRSNNDNGWFIGSATHNGSGSWSLYVSNNNGASNSYDVNATSASYACRAIIVDTPGVYDYSYNWMGVGESTYDYLRVFLAPSTMTFAAGNAQNIGTAASDLPAGCIALDPGKQNGSSSWQTTNGSVTITDPGTYYLVFFWVNDYSDGSNPPAAIDNISFATGSVTPQPATYTVSAATADQTMGSATVSPSGTVSAGTSVTFTATANQGYAFVQWNDATGATVSTSNPYTTTVTGNLALIATFQASGTPQPTCAAPTGVTATMVTENSATIGWTAGGNETQWEVECNGTTATVSANPYTLTGLTPSTQYTVRVRAVCDAATQLYSDWSASYSFSTLVGIEAADGTQIKLYPNPATTTVSLEGIEGAAKVTLVDISGRVSGEWRTESGELTIDVTGLAKGAYFVRVTGEQVNAIRKLIVR